MNQGGTETGKGQAATPGGRAQLLQIAEILFARSGFEGVSIAEIAAVGSVSKATVMHHFVTKKRLYGDVLQRTDGLFRRAVCGGQGRPRRARQCRV